MPYKKAGVVVKIRERIPRSLAHFYVKGVRTWTFIVCISIFAVPIHALQIGSDTAVSSEPFVIFPAADADNEILGFAWMDKGFALSDATTTCTFNAFFPARGPIQLNCGTLWLTRDFIMHNVTTFTCMGNIRATESQSLELANTASMVGCIESYLHRFDNINLIVNSDITMHSYIQFYGDSIIEGNGHLIDLDTTGSFIIASNSTLTLRNLTLSNFGSNNLYCEDNSSTLILNNVTLLQTNLYQFEQGSILFTGNVDWVGSSTFSYESPYTSTIDSYAQLRIGDIAFQLGKHKDNLQEPLYFTDDTSVLFLDGCDLVVTDSGIQFTRGQLTIADEVSIDVMGTTTQTGLLLGDGTVGNDMEILLKPGTSMNHLAGYLVYNNTSPSKFRSLSPSARFLRYENSKLAVHQDFEVNNLISDAASQLVTPAEITPGKFITYTDSTIKFPSLEVEVNAKQSDAYTYLLLGNSSLFLTKGAFPLVLSVSGSNNTLRGTGDISGPVVFSDSTAALTWDLAGSMGNSLTLSEGTLTLAHDMDLINDGSFVGPGTVDLGTNHLAYKKMFTATTPIYWKGSMNSHILLCCNNSLSTTWTVQGVIMLNGQGTELQLDDNANLVIDAGSKLILKDITITGVKENNIRCLDNNGTIQGERTYLVLDGDYTFTTGSWLFNFDTTISGTNTFQYDSAYTSTITKNSTLMITGGATFSIGRKESVTSPEPLYFEDSTAGITIDNSRFSVGSNGMQLTNGTMHISRNATMDINSTSTVNGLMLGDGTASHDFKIELDPSALLTLNPGNLIYNVTYPDGISTQAKTARIIHQTGFSTYYLQDFIFQDVSVQLNPLTSFILAPGVQSRVIDIALETPFGNYRVTGSRHSVASINLEGSGDYVYVDTQSFPFAVFVSGTNNTMGGAGDVAGIITLQDDATALTMQLLGHLTASPVLNGGSITLDHNLSLGNSVVFGGNGTLHLGEYGLHTGAESTTWSGDILWTSVGGPIQMNSSISLSGTWTFQGNCLINGNGHKIDLGDTGEIWVDSSSRLMLHDIYIDNATRVHCVDDSAIIALDNVIWSQGDGIYVFDNGALQLYNKVIMNGTGRFVYQTSQTSTLAGYATLQLDSGFTFSYDAPAANLLYFTDATGKLVLSDATLHATSAGLELTTGIMEVTDSSFIASEIITEGALIDNGITLGSGVFAEDFEIKIYPNTSLSCTSGRVKYKNTSPSLVNMLSNLSSLHFYTGTILELVESIDVRPGYVEFEDRTSLLSATGKTFTGSLVPRGYLYRGRS